MTLKDEDQDYGSNQVRPWISLNQGNDTVLQIAQWRESRGKFTWVQKGLNVSLKSFLKDIFHELVEDISIAAFISQRSGPINTTNKNSVLNCPAPIQEVLQRHLSFDY